MKQIKNMIPYILKSKAAFIISIFLLQSLSQAQTTPIDVNSDGALNILVIGTSNSIKSGYEAFSPTQISIELKNIVLADPSISLSINVVAEDIYRSKFVSTDVSSPPTTTVVEYFCHSLLEYYYWPDGRDSRIDNLKGNNGVDWDYVVIGADPYMIANLPGYYSLGVNKIAAKVHQGGAIPLLLMEWSKNETLIDHFEEFTYRTSSGAKVPIKTIPAGLAWKALPIAKKDVSSTHPTPNGAFVAASSIFSHIFNKSASSSQYVYDDVIADIIHNTVVNELTNTHFVGNPTFISPYKSCEISDPNLIYNHGGTSTENGILGGLQWVVTEAQKTLSFSSSPTIHFNYGRSSRGTSHIYTVNPALFDYSFGYPLQDNSNTGLVTMQYGLDKRVNETDVETDLGVAIKMVRDSELPYARNVPMRTLIAQMLEEIPGVNIYSDSWHLGYDVNKAIGSYMYTILTSDCALAGDAIPTDSAEWRTWMAHKIGYETAWNVMYISGTNPCFGSPIGIKKNSKVGVDLLIYPNPSSGIYNLQTITDTEIIIIDVLGKIILNKIIKAGSHEINLNDRSAGIYFLKANSKGEVKTARLIKY